MWPKFSLRTLLIAAPLLAALFGMLWRCGQIDYDWRLDYELGGHARTFRILRTELVVYPGGLYVTRVQQWMSRKQVQAMLADGTAEARELHAASVSRHPWDGRDWIPIGGPIIFQLHWAEWWQGSKSPASIAPSWPAVEAQLEPYGWYQYVKWLRD